MDNRKPRLLALDILTRSDALQARSALDAETVDEYAQLIRDGVKFPAIDCIDTGSGIVVTDGNHRVEGHRKAGRDSILAVVTSGTWADAVWAAAGANRDHGLRRSVADKRKAVLMLLSDAKHALLSDRDIARHVAVSHTFVASMRKRPVGEIADEHIAPPDSETRPPRDPGTLADDVERRMEAARELLGTLATDLAGVTSAAKALLDDDHPAAAFLSGSVLSDLKNAAAAIRFAMPAAVCPYCSGDGCTTCKRGGWVGKLFWDTAVPAELKS